MYQNGYNNPLTFYNSLNYYGNNNNRNQRTKNDQKPPNDWSPSNGPSQPDQYGSHRYNTYPSQKNRSDGWNPRNQRNGSDSSLRSRNGAELPRPFQKPYNQPHQQQQPQQQQELKTDPDPPEEGRASVPELQHGRDRTKTRTVAAGKGTASHDEPKGYNKGQDLSSECPSNGDRVPRGNGKPNGRRPHNNQRNSNGTLSSPQTHKPRQNGYPQRWDNSSGNNARNNFKTRSNNHHQNANNNNHIVTFGHPPISAKQFHLSQDDLPFQIGFISPVSAALNKLQRSLNVLVTPDREPRDLKNGSCWDELSTDIWSEFIANQQRTDILTDKITAVGLFYNSMKPEFYNLFVPDRKSPEVTLLVGTNGLYLVGSTFNGFGLNTSDIDICFMVHNVETNRDYALHMLKCIRHGFMKTGITSEWRVKPLVILVKIWAKFHEINDAKEMTLSSYSLTLMVIHYLQYGARPVVLPCLQKMSDRFSTEQPLNILSALNFPSEYVKPFHSANKQSLGELLVGFFEYYAAFDFTQKAISVRLGSTVTVDSCRSAKTPKNDEFQWKYIAIEEPFDQTNTARSVFDYDKFQYIVEVFRYSARVLSQTRKLDSIFVRIINRAPYPVPEPPTHQ